MKLRRRTRRQLRQAGIGLAAGAVLAVGLYFAATPQTPAAPVEGPTAAGISPSCLESLQTLRGHLGRCNHAHQVDHQKVLWCEAALRTCRASMMEASR